MDEHMQRVTLEGARGRYGVKPSMKVRRQLVKEFDLIGRLGFSGYLLIVWDIINFAPENQIMVQGGGARRTEPYATAWASLPSIR